MNVKIFYLAQALSGVFLAEQIRQQQLASELQNHLGGQQNQANLTAMQVRRHFNAIKRISRRIQLRNTQKKNMDISQNINVH